MYNCVLPDEEVWEDLDSSDGSEETDINMTDDQQDDNLLVCLYL